MKKLDFGVFVTLWNMTQNFETPNLHYKISEWLQNSWENGDKRLLLMAFRASGKSTITALFCAWLLWRNSDLRIMVLAADEDLARKMVRNIKKIIELHPLTFMMKPERADQWATDRFIVNRKRESRDPSVLAAGIFSNITGNRADIIIYDDVEVPNTCDTFCKRETLREKLVEGNFILTPGGTHLYIGTPHNYFSIYAQEPRKEINEKEIFLNGYKKLLIPILDEHNQSAWPENYTLDEIKNIKRSAGPNKFSSQMMLEPKNITQGRLDTSLLQPYETELDYKEVQRKMELSLDGRKVVSCSAWWDPAFGVQNGDGSVLAIIYADNEGDYWLHHLEYIIVKMSAGEDEASLQCQKVAELAEKFYIPSIAIEINGIGKFLPAILRRELGVRNIPCAVIEKSSSRAKDLRILEAFDAVLAAKALHVHKRIYKTPFITEMMEWRPSISKGHDDGLDAVAGAISLEPVRLKRSYYTGSNHSAWHIGGQAYKADSNFDV